MTTKQPDYDVSPDFGTLVEKHRQLPFKRFMDVIASKLDDLNEMLKRPTPYDQGPGRIVPYSIPVWFGPLPLTTAGRAGTLEGQDGFQAQAKLASSFDYYVPKNGNIVIDREMSFHAHALGAFGFVNWGYKSNPGFTVQYTNPSGVGDILDPVGDNPAIGPNGGAMPLDFFGGTFSTLSETVPNLPNISVEVELYDKLRNRRMHEGRLPIGMLAGGRIDNKKSASVLKWEKGSIIEPRLYVNEIRMGSVLDGATAYEAASVKAWVCILFKGTQHVEIPNV